MLTQSEQPLRAAVIGVGHLGRFHAQKFKRIAGVELVTVVDTDAARARQVGEELQIPWTDDFRPLLDHRVDLVSIAVPTRHHFAVAKACLSAGIHVLLEKPMTVTQRESAKLVQLAQRRDCLLQVGHIKRFHPCVEAVRQGDYLRRPRYIQSHRMAPFKDRSLDVDVVLDLMVHDIDLALLFAGAEVVSIEAFGRSMLDHSRNDIATARLFFANGCVADLNVSRVAHEAQRTLSLFQKQGSITIDFIAKTIELATKTPATAQGSISDVTRRLMPVNDQDALEQQIRSFCHAVRHHLPVEVDGRVGHKVLTLALAVLESIQAGKRMARKMRR
ncbi:MAG: Gfo/Idh/MocA family oxidoreductase [Magnetococcales bacterium]|nr:Gfo/Idh/MocA family oxidoreductase [Magnetococcales bacterium]